VDGCWGLIACTASQDYTLRPIPELSQYQIPGIDNFYMASGSCHFSYALMGFAGYNCYKKIARDLDLKKPWEEQGRLI
jgi:phytoene dehydrogenase-like protein